MLFADETVLYFTAHSVTVLEIVFGMNNIASCMMQENKVFLHKRKTEYVVYGTRQNPRLQEKMSLLYEGSELQRVSSFK